MTRNEHINSFQEIANEYNESATKKNDFEKSKWGSAQSMQNRFDLALKTINWKAIHSWIDIGCGTGALLEYIENHKIDIDDYTGLDISQNMLNQAQIKIFKTNSVQWIHENFATYFPNKGFDLITAIGVLQKCGLSLNDSVKEFKKFCKKDTYLFLTTKNYDWNKFHSKELIPFQGHLWFTQEELISALKNNNFKILEINGFLPYENKIVSIKESHTVYILAQHI